MLGHFTQALTQERYVKCKQGARSWTISNGQQYFDQAKLTLAEHL